MLAVILGSIYPSVVVLFLMLWKASKIISIQDRLIYTAAMNAEGFFYPLLDILANICFFSFLYDTQSDWSNGISMHFTFFQCMRVRHVWVWTVSALNKPGGQTTFRSWSSPFSLLKPSLSSQLLCAIQASWLRRRFGWPSYLCITGCSSGRLRFHSQHPHDDALPPFVSPVLENPIHALRVLHGSGAQTHM